MPKRIFTMLIFLLLAFFSHSQCVINELSVVPTVCNDNGKFSVKINFNHSGTTNQFQVLGNGVNYGTFNYSELPLTLGPLNADCVTDYEFVVKDVIMTSCLAVKIIGKKCCPNLCNVKFKNFESGECDGSVYPIHFDLEHLAAGNGFDLYNNGVHYGFYQYSQLPLSIPQLPSSTTETFNKIVVCANDSNTCCDTISVLNPCICSIYRIQGQVINCSEENANFAIKLNFKYHNNSDSFFVGGNNSNYGKYAYSDLPITITNLPFSATTDYEFLIVDSGDAFCFGSYALGKVTECNFHCNISNVKALPYQCEDGLFYVKITFDSKNTSIAGFTIKGSGHDYGIFEYGESFYKIGPIVGDCITKYEFVVKDKELIECSAQTKLEEPVCCEQSCMLKEMAVSELCENDTLTGFNINFIHSGTSDKFVLRINNILTGTYKYTDLPLTITDLSFGLPTANIRVFDNANESCNLLKAYTFNCAQSSACNIHDMTVVPGECRNDQTFIAKLRFKVDNPQSAHFVLKVNGQVYDTLTYGQDLYEIGPFHGDCVTDYSFLIYDLENPNCAEDFTFAEKICCGQSTCSIRDLTITEMCENNNLVGFTINFLHTSTSDKFVLRINNKLIGTYKYTDLPLKVTDLSFGLPTANIRIFDSANEACSVLKTYTFDCIGSQDCRIYDMTVTPGICHSDKTFYAVLKFKVTNPKSSKFRIKVNGQIFDTLSYGNTQYEIGPFAGDCSTIYKFLVQDLENLDCGADFTLPNKICCNDAECKISEPLISISECKDGKYHLTLNFSHISTTVNFKVKINGVTKGPFTYANLPIVIENLSEKIVYEITIQDNEKETCKLSFLLPGVECISASQDELIKAIKFFQNTDYIDINIDEKWSPLKLRLVDINGRVLQAKDLYEFSRVNISDLTPGLYFIQLSNDKHHFTKKIIKI